jgi:hypothetical protein
MERPQKITFREMGVRGIGSLAIVYFLVRESREACRKVNAHRALISRMLRRFHGLLAFRQSQTTSVP